MRSRNLPGPANYGDSPTPATGPEATPVRRRSIGPVAGLRAAHVNPLYKSVARFIDFSTGGWPAGAHRRPTWRCNSIRQARPASRCAPWKAEPGLGPLRAHAVFEFPAHAAAPRERTPTRTCAATSRIPGMAEGGAPPGDEQSEREGPPIRSGRRRHDAGQHPVDCGWQAHHTSGPWWGSSWRWPRTGWSGWTRSSSWRFPRSQNARSRQRRCVCRIEVLPGNHRARRWRLAAAGVAVGGIQTAAATVAARHQSPAGLDSRLQVRRTGRVGFAVATNTSSGSRWAQSRPVSPES